MILIDQRNNRDPYINAAIEEYIVRGMVPLDTLYITMYINSPCVVVGKNQSIYKEINFDYLRSGQPVIRRVSGGGTVYHDEGNLCFAFLCSFDERKVNNYVHFNQPILDALQRAGIDAQFNKRNDILWDEKKISGNAQFTDRKNILSHGTLLVNSDLDKLRGALKQNAFEIESKAVSSTRSSVMNISERSDRFKTADELKEYLSKELPISGTYSFSDDEWAEINETAVSKFQSDEWLWGRNPYTKIMKQGVTIEVDGGIIVDIESGDERLKALVGKKYNYAGLKGNVDELVKLIF
ncbi:MAG: lplJ [Bacteroidetes bacterium]|nr:lplJ [Bacteroidota bacterium]